MMKGRVRLKDIIIYETDDLIAINKPPFMSSLHERFGSEFQSVIELAKEVNDDYQLCHRLDRETSGVLLIAKNPETYRLISLQFEKRQIQKIYHAIVPDSVSLKDLQVDLPLYTDSKRRVQVSRKDGKPSLTIFNSLHLYKHFTLLECQPLTGRLHQIRIHAASQNLPLVCDQLYGGKTPLLGEIKRKVKSSEEDVRKPIMNRVALHAYSIRFKDAEGNEVQVNAPYAKDMEVFLKLLGKYDELG